ncbi:MAG: hypothetical protein OXD44_09915 [Gammaproteobacteria bacterium]|nr:hypothetical protein [Gammaproteobacteria bacterium]MCY4227498.1 hypothetical protein [Gammaproteobacteria bacterium]MCY4313985.1 hypothetical protein [Gammaproteobacteria bacterium]
MNRKPNKAERPRSNPFDSGYQPGRQDKEQKIDMPGADMKTLQKACFSGKVKK